MAGPQVQPCSRSLGRATWQVPVPMHSHMAGPQVQPRVRSPSLSMASQHVPVPEHKHTAGPHPQPGPHWQEEQPEETRCRGAAVPEPCWVTSWANFSTLSGPHPRLPSLICWTHCQQFAPNGNKRHVVGPGQCHQRALCCKTWGDAPMAPKGLGLGGVG